MQRVRAAVDAWHTSREGLAEAAYDTPRGTDENMPCVKIAPSVLASDLGNLTHECNRMLTCGADWLHMGPCLRLLRLRQTLWMATLCPTFPSDYLL